MSATTEHPFPILCLLSSPAFLQDASHREADSYLFDLDHFVNMHADPGTKPVARATLPPLPFDSTPECDHLVVNAHNKGGLVGQRGASCVYVLGRSCLRPCSAFHGGSVTADRLPAHPPCRPPAWLPTTLSTPTCPPARPRAAGSVARFLNHSCKPNLMSQPVLRQRDSGLRYCIALVSTE